MPVSGVSILNSGEVFIDLSAVVSWSQDGQLAVVHLTPDTFEIDEISQQIWPDYVHTLDLDTFETAMSNYLASLVASAAYLLTEDGVYLTTEDGFRLMT